MCVAIATTFCCFIQIAPHGFQPAPGMDSLPAALVFLIHSAIRIRPGILKHLAPACFILLMSIMTICRPTGDIDKILAFSSMIFCLCLYGLARIRWSALKAWNRRNEYQTFKEAWAAFMLERKQNFKKQVQLRKREEWKRIG